MTDAQIALTILLASTAVSVVYLCFALAKRSKTMAIKGVTMLICPPVGPLYYLGQMISALFMKKGGEVDFDEVSFSKERSHRVLSPDVTAELQAAPLEEILLVSSNADRRKHLLLELKKDSIGSYGAIVKAIDNDDPETSHYAASAITNAKADFENDIREYDIILAKTPGALPLIRDYSDYVLRYLHSGLLDPIEVRKYRYLYLNLMTSSEGSDDFLTDEDYSNLVDQAILVGDYAVAEKWANLSHERLPGESGYLNLLKVQYYTNRTDSFLHTLDEMKKSDVFLSLKGLSLVRFFLKPKRPAASERMDATYGS